MSWPLFFAIFSQFVPYAARPRGLTCVGFRWRNVLWQVRRSVDVSQRLVCLRGVRRQELNRTRQWCAGTTNAIGSEGQQHATEPFPAPHEATASCERFPIRGQPVIELTLRQRLHSGFDSRVGRKHNTQRGHHVRTRAIIQGIALGGEHRERRSRVAQFPSRMIDIVFGCGLRQPSDIDLRRLNAHRGQIRIGLTHAIALGVPRWSQRKQHRDKTVYPCISTGKPTR